MSQRSSSSCQSDILPTMVGPSKSRPPMSHRKTDLGIPCRSKSAKVVLGRVVDAARAHGYPATGADIVSRNTEFATADFLETTRPFDNAVTNPPFSLTRRFAEHALTLVRHKVALLFPVACLKAAGKWLAPMPLCRVWLLTPRPSMPPASVILRGEKPRGGRADFCWLVLDKAFTGRPTINWLARDGA